MDEPPAPETYTAVRIFHEGPLAVPDDLVMVEVMLNGVAIAQVVVEVGYRLVADADGVRVEKLWEVPPL